MIRAMVTAALGAALACSACSRTVRFDDHSIEAGPADTGPEATPSCASGGDCGFEGAPCSSGPCRLECPHEGTCQGTCGGACTADCEERSICTLIAGDGADLRCEEGAHCTFQVGPAGAVQCDRQTECNTRCLGNCSISCATGAVCRLACGRLATLAPVSGTAGCP